MILPERLHSPPRFLQIYVVVILHLLYEFQILNRQIIIVFACVWEVFFHFFHPFVYVRELPQLLIRHLLF